MASKIYPFLAYLKHVLQARHGGHGVHSPLAYALCENVFFSDQRFYQFDKLNDIRAELLRSQAKLNTENHGAGSRLFKSPERTVSSLLKHGTSRQNQAEILFRLCNFMGLRDVLELGTSIGFTTLYLAGASQAGTTYTIEGSRALSEFAKGLAGKNEVGNIVHLHARFEEVLPDLVAKIHEPCLVYIDGDHGYEATLKYFNMLLPLARGRNVFVFDDIYWSLGMTQAWNEIAAHQRVRLSIDTFYSGYLFFDEAIREKISYKLRL